MKKLFIFIILCCALGKPTAMVSQNVHPDTANYPYWVEMMQDPNANFFKIQSAFNTYWKDRKITKGCGWKVFKRWEYMMQSRINPDGSMPAPDATMKAYNSFNAGKLSQTGNWISLGPSTIPLPGPAGYEGLGLNTIAFHPTDPNKLYVGAPSGGFWYSVNGGLTWATTTETLPTLGVSAIMVDYSNPNTILIGTGDRDAGDAPGMGVYKSTDAGLTWVSSKSGMENVTVGNMIQHPSNPLIILAATSGGVFRSTNGGAVWTRSKTGIFKDIKFKPGDPNIVYAIAGTSFYRSTDNGVSFVQITSGVPSGQRSVMAVSAANPNYVYLVTSDGSSGFQGLYRSVNAGVDFTTRSTSPNILDWSCDGSGTGGQGWYDLALAVNPTNAEMVYVGGVDVWRSTNGGTTWTINSHWYGGCSVPAVHADCHFLIFSPVNGNLYACNDGGLFATTNGGTSWSFFTETMTIGQIYKLGVAQTVKEKVINGFQDNGTYTYTSTGWLATGGGDGMECAIDYTNAAYTYHTVYYGDIYRKYNNGSETHIAGNGVNGINESGAWVTPFILSKSNHRRMFVGYKNIWRANNVLPGSISFVKISNNLAGSNSSDMAVLEHSAADSNILYAARSDNKLFRSDNCLDATPVWTNLTGFLPAAVTATSIATHPTDPNTLYMTAGTKVYKSTTKGTSWTNITGNLPAIHISSIVYYKNADEGLYVGTDAGVYYRDSFTSGWISFSDGLPSNGRITELEIFYDNDSVSADVIKASSYGRGLWGSDMYHAPVTANFSANHTTIPIGCSINFTDLSAGVPTFWAWTFQGATPGTSNLKNPGGITYSTPGTYSVKLKCWNEFSHDSITKTDYITVSGTLLPSVDFTSNKQALCIGDTVRFTDLTQNCPYAWSWQFTPGAVTYVNGTGSYDPNPQVVFNNPGPYDVKLSAANAVGQSSLTKTSYIINGGYNLPFVENFSGGLGQHYWTIVNPGIDMTWDTITVPGITPGSRAVWMNFYNYPAVNERDQLISPPLMMPSYPPVELSFRHAYAQRDPIKDSLIIKISEDCGLTWTRLWAMGPDGTPLKFVTAAPTNNAFVPQSSGDWCSGSYGVSCYAIDLQNYIGKSNIRLMFESFNRNGNNLYITDITVQGEVGIADNILELNGVSIYPNPSHGLFTLECKQCREAQDLSVISGDGIEVFVKRIPESKQSMKEIIDLRGLSKGVYFIRLTGNNNTRVGKLLIN
ncbi:MAG: PKD domain-containing protein [Bacteroidetes bacterium]|nr:PKD domain-containing protein [Bacteroidota bacterium]